ncbi:MAG: sulfate transporter CysZ [Candidatus Berkiella sp.]
MLNDFYKGSTYALRGFLDMFQPGVKRYVYVPLLINVLVFGIIFYFGSHYIIEKSDFQFLHTLPKWLAWASGLIFALKKLLVALIIILLFALCAIVSTFCANIIGAPFNGLLSDAYATKQGINIPSRTLFNTMGAALLRELKKYLYYIPRALGVGLVAMILFFIPVLNLALPILFYGFTSAMMAIEYIDYPADSQHVAFSDLLQKKKEHPWLFLGFGLTVAMLSTIPILNLFVMPAAVVGATRLWHENHKI